MPEAVLVAPDDWLAPVTTLRLKPRGFNANAGRPPTESARIPAAPTPSLYPKILGLFDSRSYSGGEPSGSPPSCPEFARAGLRGHTRRNFARHPRQRLPQSRLSARVPASDNEPRARRPAPSHRSEALVPPVSGIRSSRSDTSATTGVS